MFTKIKTKYRAFVEWLHYVATLVETRAKWDAATAASKAEYETLIASLKAEHAAFITAITLEHATHVAVLEAEHARESQTAKEGIESEFAHLRSEIDFLHMSKRSAVNVIGKRPVRIA